MESLGESSGVAVETMQLSDWEQIRAIYLSGIASGDATFETEPPSREQWEATHISSPRLVARSGERILGWAALSRVSSRAAYRGVAEVSVYVAEVARGRGVGRMLLEALVAGSEREGFWTLQASVFPENEASVRLHSRCGFREVGRRERIGRLNGVWRSTLLLERRSLQHC